MTTIVWFRQDLRLSDNPALIHAAERGPIVPVYILDVGAPRQLGGASKWWLHHSLQSLHTSLGNLVYLRGDPSALLPELIKQTGAQAVFWNRCYEPYAIARDKTIKAELRASGLDVRSFNAGLLFEPWEISTRAGGPFKVYSPFWRAAQAREPAQPLATADVTVAPLSGIGEDLSGLGLLPSALDWAAGWPQIWTPGEAGAQARLAAFLESGLDGYGVSRNRPDLENVSRLSPYLHFGEISPRQISARLSFLPDKHPHLNRDAGKFLSEIGWRDSDADLEAWQRGMTGYPLVDAGMRELWHTGYMHNRVRMVAASFLVKHLRLHWRHGEAWFWDTLVDADLANNAAGWQWVAGSGADAAPYFRIFNPIAQGRKFDPEGSYVRRWCPELSGLDSGAIHAPFELSEETLEDAGVRLGNTYPRPLIDHAKARAEALAGYETVKAASR